MINQVMLKDFLHYNPETGVFTWLERDRKWFGNNRIWLSWNAKKKGARAGSNALGYLVITIHGKKHKAHRLAWLYMYGNWPEKEIDHINHNGEDNRISNLRDVTHRANGLNQSIPRNNKSGIGGVSWNIAANKWVANIRVKGKRIYLGEHKDFFEAVCARKSAQNAHGFHKNHGSLMRE